MLKSKSKPHYQASYRAPVGAELVYLGASQNFQPLHHPHQRGFDFDFKHFDRIYKVG
jgi:hypothetical protein